MSGRPFLSGHCNPSNPPNIHALCRGGIPGKPCSCSHHVPSVTSGDRDRARVEVDGRRSLVAVLAAYDVAGLVAALEVLVSRSGVWPPAVRRLVVDGRELLGEVQATGVRGD